MKNMNNILVEKTATLLQQLTRGYLLRKELRMLRQEHPDFHRSFSTSKLLVHNKSQKSRNREESTPSQRIRVEKALRAHAKSLNVAMYHWRAVRREYKDCEQLTVDKDATLVDLDKRCESVEVMLGQC